MKKETKPENHSPSAAALASAASAASAASLAALTSSSGVSERSDSSCKDLLVCWNSVRGRRRETSRSKRKKKKKKREQGEQPALSHQELPRVGDDGGQALPRVRDHQGRLGGDVFLMRTGKGGGEERDEER